MKHHLINIKFTDKFNLYVKNLSESIDEKKLREIFGSCGKIVSAKVMRDESGKCKGFGFVGFSNLEESQKAKRELNGFSVDGKSLVVRVAERKEDRFKRMQQYYQVQQRHYTQAPLVPAPAQPIPRSMPSSYGYLQPFHIGASYYYMGTQLPQMLGHQNIATYVPAGQAHLKQKRSVQLVYRNPVYTFAKSGAKQKLVFKEKGNQNLEASTCSKAKTSAEELEKYSSELMAMLTPNKKAEKN